MHSGNGSHTIEIVLNQKFVLHVLLAVSPKKLSRFVCNYEVGEACKWKFVAIAQRQRFDSETNRVRVSKQIEGDLRGICYNVLVWRPGG